jgi:riboflavin kinase/FMN adenylyltransferase
MIILKNFFEDVITEDVAVTIGKFDGFHVGHEELLNLVKQQRELKHMVVTFDVSPRIKLNSGEDRRNLLSFDERLEYLRGEGIDYVLVCSFDDRFMETSPEDFLRILVDRYKMRYLAVGDDFTFGYRGLGDANLLKDIHESLGFELEVIPKLQDEGYDISSSRVREEIKRGDVEAARKHLGYPYFVSGVIKHGKRLGRRLGVPTINLIPDLDKILPRNGVYLTKVYIEGEEYCGITNVGVRPSVEDGNGITVETNILGFEGDIYGVSARLDFLKFVRPEQKFENLDELKRQIEADIEVALDFFNIS